MDCEKCDSGLGERCLNGAVRKSDFIVAKCKTGVFEKMSTTLSIENTGKSQCISKCEKDETCIGFHMQAAKPDMNLPVMCITKHFSTPEQVNDNFALGNEHALSKKMTNDSEIERYSQFVKERQDKIDLWHRQFENMTIEENGIIKTFSEYEIMQLENDPKSDGRFNMIFANKAIQKIIRDYEGRFSSKMFNDYSLRRPFI